MRSLERESTRFTPERVEAAKLMHALVQVSTPRAAALSFPVRDDAHRSAYTCYRSRLCLWLLRRQDCPERVTVLQFRALTAVAGSEVDPLRRVCLEVLRVACLRKQCTRAMVHANSFDALFAATVDPSCKVPWRLLPPD